MRLNYGAPRGARIKSGFFGVQVEGSNLWWSKNDRKWMPLSSIEGEASNTCPVHTERAFIRHLRRHPEIHGEKVILVSRFYGDGFDYSVTVDWEN